MVIVYADTLCLDTRRRVVVHFDQGHHVSDGSHRHAGHDRQTEKHGEEWKKNEANNIVDTSRAGLNSHPANRDNTRKEWMMNNTK